MTKILMVCLGNICRSPLAEGILKSKLPADKFLVDSAGTSNYHIGNSPDKRSINIAKKYNLDISDLKGRQFTSDDFKVFDYIFVMDKSNYQDIIALATDNQDIAKVKYILDESYPGKKYEVPDPYYGGEQGFENVYKMLDKACSILSKRLIYN